MLKTHSQGTTSKGIFKRPSADSRKIQQVKRTYVTSNINGVGEVVLEGIILLIVAGIIIRYIFNRPLAYIWNREEHHLR